MTDRLLVFLLLSSLTCAAQTVRGKVLDKITGNPIETASVYFDNTTVGTTTDENGKFEITYTDAIQSNLVITFLGYKPAVISDYRTQTEYTIELEEASVALNEVYLEYDDGLTREQKLRLFRQEFLGTTKNAMSCKILNEDDLILKYDKQNKVLYASSKAPLVLENKALQYEISFNLIDFEANYKYLNFERFTFTLESVLYTGTTFFRELEGAKRRKTLKKRSRAYEGSVRHFMRSLYRNSLQKEGFILAKKGFKVKPKKVFTVLDKEDEGFKTISLKERMDIFYGRDEESVIVPDTDQFKIDKYGNHLPIAGVLFGGEMGNRRVGDMLPSDYGLDSSN